MAFDGARVLSLESRRAADMEKLILRSGGVPFVAPSVRERALEDPSSLLAFLESMERGDHDLVVCMTAVGLEFLRSKLDPLGLLPRFVDAMNRVTIVSRGPKPVGPLRKLNIPIHVLVPEPNTWREIVEAIGHRTERKVAIQEYGRPNHEFHDALRALGATVTTVLIYAWELPEDTGPLQEAARRLAAREVEVVLFTSSIQLDHLLHVASELNLREQVYSALAEHVFIASVGPVMTSALTAAGLPPQIIPEHPKMGALVKAASDMAPALLAARQTKQISE
jgi:uroporphyrinogen-III synthase